MNLMKAAKPIANPDEFVSEAQTYLAEIKRDKTAAASTIRRRLATYRSFAQWIGVQDPLKGFRAPPEPPSGAKCLEGGLEDVMKMADMARSAHQKAMIALGGFCGLRVGETCAVTHENFMINGTDITLRVVGKGHKTRDIPVSDIAWAYITPAYAAALRFPTDPRLVHVSEREARRFIANVGKRALGVKVASHDLRATFAQHVYEASDHDITLVQELLGHSNIDTTRRYLRVRDTDKRSAVQVILK